MRQEILENLHQSHMEISNTKARARETVYWPNINQHTEMLIKKCEICRTYQKLEQSRFYNSGGLLQQILGDRKIEQHKINKNSQEDEENVFKTWNT